jgi:hypothetical protein
MKYWLQVLYSSRHALLYSLSPGPPFLFRLHSLPGKDTYRLVALGVTVYTSLISLIGLQYFSPRLVARK